MSGVSRRRGWTSLAELHAALLTECSLQFADLTDEIYGSSWGERHREQARRLEREDGGELAGPAAETR